MLSKSPEYAFIDLAIKAYKYQKLVNKSLRGGHFNDDAATPFWLRRFLFCCCECYEMHLLESILLPLRLAVPRPSE